MSHQLLWLVWGGVLSAPAQAAGAEPLYQLQWSASSLQVQVRSQGCTRPQDLHWQQVKDEQGRWQLTLTRQQADRCRRRPFLLTFAVPWSQLALAGSELAGGARFVVTNPLQQASAYLQASPPSGAATPPRVIR